MRRIAAFLSTIGNRLIQHRGTPALWIAAGAVGVGVYVLLDRAFIAGEGWDNMRQHVPVGQYNQTQPKYHTQEDLPPPPGEARIVGRVVHDGRPVAGAELRAIVNTLYQTPELKTDANGRFQIPVQPGHWAIDFFDFKRWPDKPAEGRFVATTGHELRAQLPYRLSRMRDRPPWTVYARENESRPQITIRLNQAVRLQWPPANANKQGTRVEQESDALQWQAPDSAQQFVVAIGRIDPVQDSGASLSPSSWLEEPSALDLYPMAWYSVTDASELPLSRVVTTDSEQQTTHTYGYRVFAFDNAGHLVSYTPKGDHGNRLFHLVGKQIQPTRHYDYDPDVGGIPTDTMVDIRQRRSAQKLEAVKQLIANARFSDAEALLAELEGDHYIRPGMTEALRGYVAAEQDRCESANKHFQAALRQNPALCAGACYGSQCLPANTGEE